MDFQKQIRGLNVKLANKKEQTLIAHLSDLGMKYINFDRVRCESYGFKGREVWFLDGEPIIEFGDIEFSNRDEFGVANCEAYRDVIKFKG